MSLLVANTGNKISLVLKTVSGMLVELKMSHRTSTSLGEVISEMAICAVADSTGALSRSKREGCSSLLVPDTFPCTITEVYFSNTLLISSLA